MRDSTAVKLLKLLSRERKAIIQADFLTVDQCVAEKEILLTTLTNSPLAAEALALIRIALEENQTLLTSAIAGVQAARTRVAELKDVRMGLRVYDQTGQIAQVQTRTTGLSKRS
ncbi:MAG: hypothetical protein ACI82I_002634 [Gammaproteobacteria bacterium]|jgi:hypothetical protein